MSMLGWNLNAAGIEFLEFKPSEIAAAVAMYVSSQMQAIDIHKAVSCLVGVEKVCVFMLVPHPLPVESFAKAYMFLLLRCLLLLYRILIEFNVV